MHIKYFSVKSNWEGFRGAYKAINQTVARRQFSPNEFLSGLSKRLIFTLLCVFQAFYSPLEIFTRELLNIETQGPCYPATQAVLQTKYNVHGGPVWI